MVRGIFQIVPVTSLGFGHHISIASNFPFFVIFSSCKFQHTIFPLCYFLLLVVINLTKQSLTPFLQFFLFLLHLYLHIFHYQQSHQNICHQNLCDLPRQKAALKISFAGKSHYLLGINSFAFCFTLLLIALRLQAADSFSW